MLEFLKTSRFCLPRRSKKAGGALICSRIKDVSVRPGGGGGQSCFKQESWYSQREDILAAQKDRAIITLFFFLQAPSSWARPRSAFSPTKQYDSLTRPLPDRDHTVHQRVPLPFVVDIRQLIQGCGLRPTLRGPLAQFPAQGWLLWLLMMVILMMAGRRGRRVGGRP